ncbi:hypothetical protein SH139x_004223 [Planctomycetaceae bacterium SH139]
MAKNDSLKQRLKQAAKRRANRQSSPATGQLASPAAMGQADTANQSQSPQSQATAGSGGKQGAAVDSLVACLLKYDQHQAPLNDRDLLAALRSLQRGYPSQDPTCIALYEQLLQVKQASQMTVHATRRAVEQLIDLVRSYDKANSSSRAAISYLHSVAD